MADLPITAANVAIEGKAVTTLIVQVGEAVTRSQPLYRQITGDSKYMLADSDEDSTTAAAEMIALTGAATDGYVMAVRKGPMDIGATLTVGAIYILSATPGKIAPSTDLASGDYLTILGYASAADTLEVDITATGIQK